MIKFFLRLFGIGQIKSVEGIMKPLVKTRKKLVKAQEQRNTAIDKNVKRKQKLDEANELHAMEAHLASHMIEGLDAQLKPLDEIKAKVEKSNG